MTLFNFIFLWNISKFDADIFIFLLKFKTEDMDKYYFTLFKLSHILSSYDLNNLKKELL